MSDDPTTKVDVQAKPSVRRIVKETDEQGVTVISGARPVDTPRARFLTVLLFGVCVVSLLAMLSVPHLDTALQVAVVAFTVAGVLLTTGITFASITFDTRGLKGVALWIDGLRFGASIVGDGIASIAVWVGIAAVVWHLLPQAFWIGLIAVIGSSILVVIIGFVYAISVAVRHYDKHQASSAAPVPEPADALSHDTGSHTPPATP